MFKNIEEQIKTCGAYIVEVDKNHIITWWPTRALMRKALASFKKKGFQCEFSSNKEENGWKAVGYRI